MKTVTALLVAAILSACGPSRATRYRQAAASLDDARTIYKHIGESLESEVRRNSDPAPKVGSDEAYHDDLKLFVSIICKGAADDIDVWQAQYGPLETLTLDDRQRLLEGLDKRLKMVDDLDGIDNGWMTADLKGSLAAAKRKLQKARELVQ
jgi:hypothetical protein